MRRPSKIFRVIGAAVCGLFVGLLAWLVRLDPFYWIQMQERASMSWDPGELWSGGGCER